MSTVRIVYVARHDQRDSNDDEGAITHALTMLGHDVQRIQERSSGKATRIPSADLLLFHKCSDVDMLRRFQGKCPRVFWYFDLVDWRDSTLSNRCRERIDWMQRITPEVDLGFCTDGDWVARDRSGKLYWLPQGADERVVGHGHSSQPSSLPILFTGIRAGGGRQRISWVDEVASRYPQQFHHVLRGCHGRELAEIIAGKAIVLAPDSPVMHKYWSNRVYMMLGFGACLIHPRCGGLLEHYLGGEEILYYTDRDSMYALIDHYLDPASAAERQRISEAGLQRTLREHLYRHRCQQLLSVVQSKS